LCDTAKNRKPYIIGFLEVALDMPTFKDVIDALDEICDVQL